MRAATQAWLFAAAALLSGCGGGSWTMPEETRAVVARASQQDPNAAFEWPAGLPGDGEALLRETTLALDQVGHYLVEVDRRHAQALTEEERARLAEVRHDTIERLFTDVSQLKAVLSWYTAQPATQQLALVFDDIEPPASDGRLPDPRSRPVKLSHLAVLETQERPAGTFWRGVSLPLALRALRDGVVEWARAQGALSPEAREQLLATR